jgi:hypothetical protein
MHARRFSPKHSLDSRLIGRQRFSFDLITAFERFVRIFDHFLRKCAARVLRSHQSRNLDLTCILSPRFRGKAVSNAIVVVAFNVASGVSLLPE